MHCLLLHLPCLFGFVWLFHVMPCLSNSVVCFCTFPFSSVLIRFHLSRSDCFSIVAFSCVRFRFLPFCSVFFRSVPFSSLLFCNNPWTVVVLFSVIIFVVPWHSLRHYLLLAHELGMANGEFGFLCIHGDVSNATSSLGFKEPTRS